MKKAALCVFACLCLAAFTLPAQACNFGASVVSQAVLVQSAPTVLLAPQAVQFVPVGAVNVNVRNGRRGAQVAQVRAGGVNINAVNNGGRRGLFGGRRGGSQVTQISSGPNGVTANVVQSRR